MNHFFNVFGCLHYSVISGNSTYKCRKTGVSVPQCWASRVKKQKKEGDITSIWLCHWSLTVHVFWLTFQENIFFFSSWVFFLQMLFLKGHLFSYCYYCILKYRIHQIRLIWKILQQFTQCTFSILFLRLICLRAQVLFTMEHLSKFSPQ